MTHKPNSFSLRRSFYNIS